MSRPEAHAEGPSLPLGGRRPPVRRCRFVCRVLPVGRRRVGWLIALFLLVGANVVLWPWVIANHWPPRLGHGTRESSESIRGASALSTFDLSEASIPPQEIVGGGPPKDGIPAIVDPTFVPARDVDFLQDTDLVLGFEHNGEAHAYPLRILVWHEIVNDTVGGLPIMGTYCPLCATCMVFSRQIDGRTYSFGVSGLLYNSDVLMYDHQTESLWSQLKGEAVAGRFVGQELNWLPSQQMTWAAWRARYPRGKVLSPDTGYPRDYGREPYRRYASSKSTMFPVPKNRNDLPEKELVAGILVDGTAKAYALRALEGIAQMGIADEVAGRAIRVTYDPAARHVDVVDKQTGTSIPNVTVYWFAWQAFYPGTELYAG